MKYQAADYTKGLGERRRVARDLSPLFAVSQFALALSHSSLEEAVSGARLN
jgi:hypothetical protein